MTLGVLIGLVMFSSAAGSLLIVAPAHAQTASTIVGDLPAQLKDALSQVWEALKNAALNAVIRLVSYAMRKVAYDGAVWLASGGKGQTPLAFNKDFGSYMGDVGNEAFGAAIESLADPKSGIGINLCKIPDIKTDLALKVGLRMPGFSGLGGATPNGQQKPSCSFSQFAENWGSGEAWKSRFTAAGNSIEQQFNAAISNADQTDFGVFLGSKQFIDTSVASKMASEQLQRLEGQGVQAVKSTISNQIKIPAVTMGEEFKKDAPRTQQEKDEQQIAAVLASGNINVLPTILGIFVNTLGSSMLKNYQEQGILPFGIGCKDGTQDCLNSGDQAAQYSSAGVLGGRRQAQQFFQSILQTVEVQTLDNYDIAGQLSSCPEVQGLYNCRADDNLVRGLKQTQSGEAVTIAKALQTGILNPNWQLLPKERQAENMDKNCYTRAFCYGNVKVLRQARILPLGFEIAAALSNADNPWTLGDVVKGFNDCALAPDGSAIVDLVHKPFCHLIDPNWVLEAPPSQCRSLVYGADRATDGAPYRRQECADLTTCVAFDQKGNCTNFAYCVREKNAWKFKADSCDAQYRTCRSFQSPSGAAVSYLYRTLNTGSCTEQNVGCTYYSLTKDQNTNAWQGPGISGTNANGVYFNSQVPNSCLGNAAGCNAFTYASSTDVTLYMKQAPDYLGCYDSDSGTPGIQWPQTTADLNRLPTNGTCDAYASACIPAEVGCNMYTPVVGGSQKVPGKFTAENVCAAQCVGYDSYREMPSNYSNGQDIAYIVPSTGQSCSAVDEGCTGFTNLKAVSGNLTEQVEYFSYLRSCVTPQQNAGKNFITYEGSVTGGGFQLKTYRLVENAQAEDADPLNPNNELGAPRYFYRTPDERTQFASECNEAAYKGPAANPDCRQFNDDKGRVFYRLLSKTVPVSSECTPYRLNDTELYAAAGVPDANACTNIYKGYWDAGTCRVCFQNGEYKDGQCFYNGLPGASQNNAGNSRSCTQAADSCKAYKGNAGNNIKVIGGSDDTFENATSSASQLGYGAVQGTTAITNESTRVGGHSLGYNGRGSVFKTVTLTIGKSYDLTFWAKGSGGVVTHVRLASADGNFSKEFGSITPGATWNAYHFGPLELSSNNNSLSTSSIRLTFAVDAQTAIFIDNVRLVEVTDYIYLLKKSLSVPAACDSVPDDNLPGEALGCKAYKDPGGTTYNLTGFNFLCRENSIGCVGVYDTHRTPAQDGPQAFGVQMSGAGGSTVVLNIGLGNNNPSCVVPVGQTKCYIMTVPANISAAAVIAAGGTFVSSSVYVLPDDEPPAEPIYLVSNKAASCNRVDLGCVTAGQLKSSPLGASFVTTTIKNDPALYSNQLCTSEALGCTKFNDAAGGSAYFKDPAVIGQKICSYKTDVLVNGSFHSGWFWKDVGTCSLSNNQCATTADCGGGANDTCANLGTLPCYPSYVDGNGNYGIWSYGVQNQYQDYVGECPVEANLCTEFIDHSDNDRAYYFIKNSKISAGDCNGQVGQKSGCALFDQTDNPNKYWSTSKSYQNSDAADGQSVSPVAEPGTNDANILIQVQPGRVCGEWLQCLSSHPVTDPITGKFKAVCDQIGRCDQAAASSGDPVSACAHWVTQKTSYAIKPLTKELYVGRDVTWKGMDFAGFSLLDTYPLDSLTQINVDPNMPAADGWRLAKVVPCGGSTSIGGPSVCKIADPKSSSATCIPAKDEPNCGGGGEFNIPCLPLAACGTAAVPGVCTKGGVCAQTINGKNDDRLTDNAIPQICRAYPEKDSPFPNLPTVENNGQFKGANTCNESSSAVNGSAARLCDCRYTRVEYGSFLTKFWNYTRPNNVSVIGERPGHIPDGLCQGGDRNGYECTRNSDCHQLKNASTKEDFSISNSANAQLTPPPDNKPIIDGTCALHKRVDTFLGWQGFCVEQDITRPLNGDPNQHPCLTWWPIDSLNGAADINNQHVEAGYVNPNPGGTYYCLGASGGGGVGQWNASNSAANVRSYYAHMFRSINVASVPVGGADQKNWGGPSDTDQFWRGFFAPLGDEVNIHQQDIERIDFSIAAGQNGPADDPEADPAGNVVFSMWPDDLSTDHKNSPQAVYENITTRDPNGHADQNPGIAVVGQYLGFKNEWILFYSSSHKDGQVFPYLDKTGSVCYSPQGAGPNNCDIVGGTYGLAGNVFDKLYSQHATLNFNEALVGYDVNGQWQRDIGIWDSAHSNQSICPEGSSFLNNSGGNWHALRLRFDPATGKFFGFYTANCDDTGGAGGIVYNVTFHLKEWCPVIADARVSYTGDNTAVAWTNNIWKAGILSQVGPLKYGESSPTLSYDFNAPFSPNFGSLAISGVTPLKKVSLTGPQLVKDAQGNFVCGPNVGSCSFVLSDLYTVQQGVSPREEPAPAGLPYSCKEGLGKNCVGASGNTYYLTNAETNNQGALGAGATGEMSLNTIFAKVFDIQSFNYGTGGAGDRYMSVPAYNHTDSLANGGPKIYSVGACDKDGKCQESMQNKFTINKLSGENILLNGANKAVKIAFFGAAHADQMPLREVKVDWGDGSISAPGRGAYRNQRGMQRAICNGYNPGVDPGTCRLVDDAGQQYDLKNGSASVSCTNGVCPIVPRCVAESVARNFGRIIDRTCDNSYFEFTHSYQCLANQEIGWHEKPEDCGNPDLFPSGCCIYQPKVQLKDNWGWCTGTCNGNSGCYDDNKNNGILGQGVGSAGDSCREFTDSPNSWIPYSSNGSNAVIVKPTL